MSRLPPSDPAPALTHLDAAGRARMVDVGSKDSTPREATATARVRMSPELASLIRRGEVAKGDLPAAARIAGIQAAKRTAALIPLCHPLPLDAVEVDLDMEPDGIRIRTRAACTGRTGVEMEALVAASVAALVVVDMGKAVDPRMTVEDLRVTGKRGGRSGSWGELADDAEAP